MTAGPNPINSSSIKPNPIAAGVAVSQQAMTSLKDTLPKFPTNPKDNRTISDTLETSDSGGGNGQLPNADDNSNSSAQAGGASGDLLDLTG